MSFCASGAVRGGDPSLIPTFHVSKGENILGQYPPTAAYLRQDGENAIEFYLLPNGDIDGLKLISSSGFVLLDKNSTKTIEIAYKDYPRPPSRTLIRFHITYYLRYR